MSAESSATSRYDNTGSRRCPLLLLLVLMLLAGCDVRPNRAVEAPPEQYASGPTQTGKTWEMVLKDPAQVNYFCSLAMGEMPQKGGYWMGCYRPDLDAVVLMEKSAWPSRSEWGQLRAHEWAHARGWRHNNDGHGTSPASLPPQQANMFAHKEEVKPPMTGNIFRGR